MKKMLSIVVIAAVMAVSSGAVASEQDLQIDGSTTVGPIADAFAEAFKSVQPGLTITVKKTGSGDGAAALIDGRCDIATMSRFMKPEEFEGAWPTRDARRPRGGDGRRLRRGASLESRQGPDHAQVRDIYTGKITNWRELGGPTQLSWSSAATPPRAPMRASANRDGQGQDVRKGRVFTPTRRHRLAWQPRPARSPTLDSVSWMTRSRPFPSTALPPTRRPSPLACIPSAGHCSCSPTVTRTLARPVTPSAPLPDRAGPGDHRGQGLCARDELSRSTWKQMAQKDNDRSIENMATAAAGFEQPLLLLRLRRMSGALRFLCWGEACSLP